MWCPTPSHMSIFIVYSVCFLQVESHPVLLHVVALPHHSRGACCSTTESRALHLPFSLHGQKKQDVGDTDAASKHCIITRLHCRKKHKCNMSSVGFMNWYNTTICPYAQAYFSDFVHIRLHPCEWAFLLCQDNTSIWQVWHIKELIKWHDHDAGAPCAGDNKRTLKCTLVTQHNAIDVSSWGSVHLACWHPSCWQRMYC
jgi:hypothetical protein